MLVPPRSAEFYVLQQTGFTPVANLGSGKTASAMLVSKGRLLRVIRLHKPKIEMDDIGTHLETIRRAETASYHKAKNALRTRAPRITNIFIVYNSKRRPLALATVMEYIRGESLHDHLMNGTLSHTKIKDLRTLFRMLWTHRISHGDAVCSNILFDDETKRYVFIDNVTMRQHATSQEARERDMGAMWSSMPPKLLTILAHAI